MVDFKKINWKQPRYIIPLIAFLPTLYIAYQVNSFMEDKPKKETEEELSTGLGETKEQILSKMRRMMLSMETAIREQCLAV